MQVIETRQLCRSYGSRRGIADINLTISAGEIFGFLGPNGAGKSTTIRVLMGLLRAGSGVANIFGRDCWSEGTEIRREVGYVAGDVRLYPWLTTRRALAMLSRIHGRSLNQKGYELAERFRLEPDLPVRKMSRGNRQKVALVLALAHEPKLVILDEPTSGLDPLMQDTLMSCLREMAASGRTVMFSSHTLSEVESLCDRIAIVRDGRIVEDSTVSRLKAQAPRQIVVTLHDDQDHRNLKWPDSVVVQSVPQSSRPAGFSLPKSVAIEDSILRDRTCVLQLVGSSVSFMSWAAAQGFADIMIGPPSLEVLFRKYYETSTEAA
jgi:ABC-2 type transport system ATP-binding protein